MDLKKWYDNNSYIYRNIEIKGTFLAELYTEIRSNKKRSLFYYLLRNKKWEALTYIKKNDFYTYNVVDIKNSNAYIMNFDPEDDRNFDHMKTLIEKDNKSIILTMNKKVYDFYKNFKPVVFFDIRFKNNYLNKDKYFEKNKLPKRYKFIKNRALSLIDLLYAFEKEYGFPKKVISLQDFHFYDHIFTQFYKNKIPTITLQHGMIFTEGILWSFVFSDYIIVWGENSKNKLSKLGIPIEKIKVLGTAKYDQYLKEENIKNRKNHRILFSIQPQLSKEFLDETINFIKNFVNSSNYNIWIRYHPAVKKHIRKKIYNSLNKNKFINNRVFISSEKNPIKDLLRSDILLASKTSLAVEALLFETIVIEYLSKKIDKYYDYRDAVPHFLDVNKLIDFIEKIYKENNFKDKIIKEQSKYIDKEIKKPPRTKEILDFINEV